MYLFFKCNFASFRAQHSNSYCILNERSNNNKQKSRKVRRWLVLIYLNCGRNIINQNKVNSNNAELVKLLYHCTIV